MQRSNDLCTTIKSPFLHGRLNGCSMGRPIAGVHNFFQGAKHRFSQDLSAIKFPKQACQRHRILDPVPGRKCTKPLFDLDPQGDKRKICIGRNEDLSVVLPTPWAEELLRLS
jgi:hypothetical protein